MIRQGDVLLVPAAEPHEDCDAVRGPDGRLVLAEGELTGHAHVLESEEAELVRSRTGGELYLLVGGSARLTHEEHEQILVPPGSYRVVRQREYRPDGPPRYVAD